MPGHAGFSFGFTATANKESRSDVLRVPPPNVRRLGTADVIRRARVVHALRDTDVPVVDVIWSGEDERWCGSPYFIVNKLEGAVLRSNWGWDMPAAEMRPVSFQAMRALTSLHLLDWREYVPDDGPPLELEPDVTRWDRFYERSDDMDLVALAPGRAGEAAGAPAGRRWPGLASKPLPGAEGSSVTSAPRPARRIAAETDYSRSSSRARLFSYSSSVSSPRSCRSCSVSRFPAARWAGAAS
ncbi:MAG: hypothetical protein OXE43_01325 [Chloroflexi bacterium]|nr:hypothetical protein [Chloroflexota bacterium]